MFYKYWRGRELNPELKILFGVGVNSRQGERFHLAHVYEAVMRGTSLNEVAHTKDLRQRLQIYLLSYKWGTAFEAIAPVCIRGSNLKRLAMTGFDLGLLQDSDGPQLHRIARDPQNLNSYCYMAADIGAFMLVQDITFTSHEAMVMEAQLKQIHKLANNLR